MTRSSERGKVAVAFHDGSLNGASLSVLRLVPLLEERGWSFVFWGPPESPLGEYLEGLGHRLHGAPREVGYSVVSLRQPPGVRARLRSLPAYFLEFRRFLREQSPALVHANTLYTLAEALLARAGRFPALLHVHEMLPENWKGPTAAALAHRSGVEVVAVSAASAARCAHGRRRARIVYEGADVPPERPAPRPRRDRVTVGTIGVISRRKGTDTFVEAAGLVRQETDRVDLRLVGQPSDPLDEQWAHSVLERAQRFGVRWIPEVSVPTELQDWDVFVLPSRRDPFPIVVLEAMASGLPVIGTRVDGIAEQVTPECGLLCAPEDPSDLARGILELAGNAETRDAMGAAAWRRVEQSFTLERQAEGLHDAYLGCLASRPLTRPRVPI